MNMLVLFVSIHRTECTFKYMSSLLVIRHCHFILQYKYEWNVRGRGSFREITVSERNRHALMAFPSPLIH